MIIDGIGEKMRFPFEMGGLFDPLTFFLKPRRVHVDEKRCFFRVRIDRSQKGPRLVGCFEVGRKSKQF